MVMARMKGLFVLGSYAFQTIYGEETRAEIGEIIEIAAPPMTAGQAQEDPSVLADCQILLSGWGAPVLDEAFLAAAPKLKLLLYGAGSVRGCVTDAMWDRGIRVSTAVAANAVPVAEYTLALILLGLKRFWQQAEAYRTGVQRPIQVAGAYGSTVGLVSLGTIGRLVCERLRPFDLSIIAYDPFLKPEQARALGVELVGLDEVFSRADVVSLHIPNLAETRGMITGRQVAAMKPDAVLINSARGAVVAESELADALERRPDIWAVLDVTIHETREADAPLLRLPNVIRTPHIAGSQAAECRRMGRFMADELKRYLAGAPLVHEVTRERARIMA